MKLLLSLIFLGTLLAQATGTVVVTSTTTVTGTAGTVVCTLTNSLPALPSGVHTVCSVSGVISLTMDYVITAGNNGVVGSYTQASNTVTWTVTQPTAGGLFNWQVAANGVNKSGTF